MKVRTWKRKKNERLKYLTTIYLCLVLLYKVQCLFFTLICCNVYLQHSTHTHTHTENLTHWKFRSVIIILLHCFQKLLEIFLAVLTNFRAKLKVLRK